MDEKLKEIIKIHKKEEKYKNEKEMIDYSLNFKKYIILTLSIIIFFYGIGWAADNIFEVPTTSKFYIFPTLGIIFSSVFLVAPFLDCKLKENLRLIYYSFTKKRSLSKLIKVNNILNKLKERKLSIVKNLTIEELTTIRLNIRDSKSLTSKERKNFIEYVEGFERKEIEKEPNIKIKKYDIVSN